MPRYVVLHKPGLSAEAAAAAFAVWKRDNPRAGNITLAWFWFMTETGYLRPLAIVPVSDQARVELEFSDFSAAKRAEIESYYRADSLKRLKRRR